jgi:hypothetical protein
MSRTLLNLQKHHNQAKLKPVTHYERAQQKDGQCRKISD